MKTENTKTLRHPTTEHILDLCVNLEGWLKELQGKVIFLEQDDPVLEEGEILARPLHTATHRIRNVIDILDKKKTTDE